MWRLCLIIRDVINTCDGTIYNLSAYVCDCSLGAHKILASHFILKIECDKACSIYAWFHIFVGCHLKGVVKWWIVQLNCITPLLSIFLWKKTTGWRREDAQDAGTSQIWKPFLDPHQPRLTHRHTLNSLLPSAPSSGNNMIWPCMLLKWTTQIANFLGLLIHFISAQTICHKKIPKAL